ncbi:MAG: hypothetical protein ABSA76_15390 [Bacteroidales bacterium]
MKRSEAKDRIEKLRKEIEGHNYNYYVQDVIFSNKFKQVLEKCPLFTADDVDKLKDYLICRLVNGDGLGVLKKVEESKYRPSKKFHLFV